MEDEHTWMSAADAQPGSPKYDLVCNTLAPLLRYSEEKRPKLLRLYKSADLTLRNLNQLRLLGSIEKKVRTLNEEANRFCSVTRRRCSIRLCRTVTHLLSLRR